MPRWPRKPDTDEKIAITTIAFNSGLYTSREAYIKAHKICCFWYSNWLIIVFISSRIQEGIADYIPSLNQGLAVLTNSTLPLRNANYSLAIALYSSHK